MPASPFRVSSLIATHSGDRIVDYPEVEPVVVRVQAPWRTLVEKLVLLHTAHSADEPAAAAKSARHYYDVHQLLTRPEIVAGIHEVGIAMLARDVCTYSRAAEMPAVDRPTPGFSSSPAFNDGPHVAIARHEYDERVVGQLLWRPASHPTFDECIEAVHRNSDHL